MADSSAGTIRKLRDGAGGTIGAVLWEPSLTNGLVNGQPDRLLGFPVFTDANVAAAGSNARTLAFGDMSAYYVRQVGNPVIESDPSFGFDKDLTTFRAKWRVDGDLIDVDAVTVVLQNV
jgi:HK97 family phage major capsid protein